VADTRGHEWTPKKQIAFLGKLGMGFTVAAAAKACRQSRSSVYEHRATDLAFAAAWDAAIEEGTEYLEQEARRRAVEGVRRERTIFYRGVPVGSEVIREYSDTLMIFLLKGRNPEKYAERHKHEHADVRKEAEKLAAKYGRPVEQVEQDLLLRVEAARPEAGR
jgi:hypothetical protein